jgi:mannan endo-1,4-beta-mannosidase
VLIRYDRGIDFDWSRKAPDPSVPKNFFSVRWTRDKYFSAGDYQFTFWSDDGLRIYIDDKVIYDEWKNKRAEVDYLNLSISEGYHLIKVEYYENKGYAEVGVIWEKK